MMLEGAGYRPDRALATGARPTDLLMQAQCSGQVPMVTAVLGASAGHGALIAPMSRLHGDDRTGRRSSPPAHRS